MSNSSEETDPGSDEYDRSKVGEKSDAAYLFVMITFQFFVTCYGLTKLYWRTFGTKEYKKEHNVKWWKLILQFFLIIVNVYWMWNTYKLI